MDGFVVFSYDKICFVKYYPLFLNDFDEFRSKIIFFSATWIDLKMLLPEPRNRILFKKKNTKIDF